MQSINLIKPYFRENRLRIAIGIVCLIVVDFLQLLIPRVVKWAVDDLTNLTISIAELKFYAARLIAIALLIGIFRYLWRLFLIGTSRRVEEGLRNRLFSHLMTLPASYFERTKSGTLMAHATNDITHIRMATGMGMVALTDAIVLGSAAIGFMLYIHVRLTLLVLIPMPLIIFGTRFFSKKMHQRYQGVQAAFATLTEVVREQLAGIRIIKAYGREPEAAERVRKISHQYVEQNMRLVKITGAFFPMMVFFSNISLALVIYLGGRQTIMANITTGDFVAFISYLGILTWPMMAMGWVTNLIQRGRASLDRIGAILDVVPGIADPPHPAPFPVAPLRLRFTQVSFTYKSHEKGQAPAGQTLTNINFDLGWEKTLGIIGPPGSGKTTLINLIPRLYDISKGRITLGDISLDKLRLSELRSKIALMPQEPFLFSGTIRQNITLGDSQISSRKIAAAVRSAMLEETLASFPNGLKTLVGERGVMLSGGQKQRIVLARLLVRAAPFMILDDPISQVDAQTGNAIIGALQKLTGRHTLVIVSHRLSAVQFADHIIVIDKGRITATGSHAHLLESSPYYAKTLRLQEIEAKAHAH